MAQLASRSAQILRLAGDEKSWNRRGTHCTNFKGKIRGPRGPQMLQVRSVADPRYPRNHGGTHRADLAGKISGPCGPLILQVRLVTGPGNPGNHRLIVHHHQDHMLRNATKTMKNVNLSKSSCPPRCRGSPREPSGGCYH